MGLALKLRLLARIARLNYERGLNVIALAKQLDTLQVTDTELFEFLGNNGNRFLPEEVY